MKEKIDQSFWLSQPKPSTTRKFTLPFCTSHLDGRQYCALGDKTPCGVDVAGDDLQPCALHLPSPQEKRRGRRVRHPIGFTARQYPQLGPVRLHGRELVPYLLDLRLRRRRGTVYMVVYWRYTTDRRYVVRVLAVVVAFLLVVTTYAVVSGLGYLGQTRGQVGSVLGIICDVIAVCLYGAPMEKLFHVLRYKSAVFINVHMVIAGLSNNVMWVVYGIVTSNWYIISPNIFHITVNSSTLALYLIFNPKTHPLPDSYHNTTDKAIPIEITPKASG